MSDLFYRAWDKKAMCYYTDEVAIEADGSIFIVDDIEYKLWVADNLIIEPGFAREDGVKFFAGDVVEIRKVNTTETFKAVVHHGANDKVENWGGYFWIPVVGFYLESLEDGKFYHIFHLDEWQKLGTIHDSKSKESEASDD